jgi:hypothetical protein
MKEILIASVGINTAFSLFLLSWVTDDDIKGLPSDTLKRFMTLFYFSITTFTGTGYGDLTATSDRARLVMSIYMISAFSAFVGKIA